MKLRRKKKKKRRDPLNVLLPRRRKGNLKDECGRRPEPRMLDEVMRELRKSAAANEKATDLLAVMVEMNSCEDDVTLVDGHGDDFDLDEVKQLAVPE